MTPPLIASRILAENQLREAIAAAQDAHPADLLAVARRIEHRAQGLVMVLRHVAVVGVDLEAGAIPCPPAHVAYVATRRIGLDS